MRNYKGRRFIGTCLCCNSDPALLSSIDRRTVLSGVAAIGLAASAFDHHSRRTGARSSRPGFKTSLDRRPSSFRAPGLPCRETEIECPLRRFNGSRKKRSMRWMLRMSQPRSSRSRCLESGSATRRPLAACRGYATNTPLTLARSHRGRFGLWHSTCSMRTALAF
jgi:hypothetical protein